MDDFHHKSCNQRTRQLWCSSLGPPAWNFRQDLSLELGFKKKSLASLLNLDKAFAKMEMVFKDAGGTLVSSMVVISASP